MPDDFHPEMQQNAFADEYVRNKGFLSRAFESALLTAPPALLGLTVRSLVSLVS